MMTRGATKPLFPLVVVIFALVAGAAVAKAVGPLLGLGAIAVILPILFRPLWSIPVFIFFAYTAMPLEIPKSIGVLGFGFYLYEPFVLIAAVAAVIRYPVANRYADIRTIIVLGVCGLAVIGGYFQAHPTNQIMNDVRGLLLLAVGIFIACRIVNTPTGWLAIKSVRASLWTSAIAILVAPAFGITLFGQTADAALQRVGSYATSGDASARFQTSATHVGLAALCIVVVLLITGAVTLRSSWTYLLPAFLIVFFSFSRNSVVALAVAVGVALVLHQAIRMAVRIGIGVVVAGVVLWVLAFATASSPDLPGASWINLNIRTYGSRVFGGLTESARSVDASAQYRVVESDYLRKSFDTAPMFGHGMGYAYRPPQGNSGSFTATSGRYFAHNFYLWMLVKTGIVGLALFMWSVVTPLFREIRSKDPVRTSVIGTVAGLLAVSSVAPMPLSVQSGAGLLLGALVGALCVTGRLFATTASAPVERQASTVAA